MKDRCLLALIAVIIASSTSLNATKTIAITRVFGPEHPGGKYKHPASIDQLDNGDLFSTFHGGSGEYGDDTGAFNRRSLALRMTISIATSAAEGITCLLRKATWFVPNSATPAITSPRRS